MQTILRSSAMLLLVTGTVVLAAPPKEGDAIPDITVPAHQAEKVLPNAKETLSPAAFKGKKNVVLFYFPKAMTKGCTIESCGFRDLMAKFAEADTVLIGFSPDTVDLQKQFAEKEKLEYALLGDAKKELFNALDVKGRSTWIIDKEGKIAKIYNKVTPASHPKEVLEFVEKLKK